MTNESGEAALTSKGAGRVSARARPDTKHGRESLWAGRREQGEGTQWKRVAVVLQGVTRMCRWGGGKKMFLNLLTY